MLPTLQKAGFLKQAASESVLVCASTEGENKELGTVRLFSIRFIENFRYMTLQKRSTNSFRQCWILNHSVSNVLPEYALIAAVSGAQSSPMRCK